MLLIAFGALAATLRLIAHWISLRNEQLLIASNAVEHASITTKSLLVAHVLWYLFAFLEAAAQPTPALTTGVYIGLGMYAWGMFFLAMVIRDLGPYWTEKLLISPEHKRVCSGIYKHLKHPHYCLNVGPELIGISMIMQAHITLVVGLPIYAALLSIRVMQETFVMNQKFPGYSSE